MRLDKDDELISREMAKIKDSVEYLIFIHSIDAQNKGFAEGEQKANDKHSKEKQRLTKERNKAVTELNAIRAELKRVNKERDEFKKKWTDSAKRIKRCGLL